MEPTGNANQPKKKKQPARGAAEGARLAKAVRSGVRSRRLIGAVILYILVCAALLYPSLSGEPLKSGDRAPRTIRSPKVITFTDTEATNTARRAGAAKVKKIYRATTDELVDSLLELTVQVGQEPEKKPLNPNEGVPPVRDYLANKMFLNPAVMNALTPMNGWEFAQLFRETDMLIRDVTVDRGWINSDEINSLEKDMVRTARGRNISATHVPLTAALFTGLYIANRTFDSRETERQRQAAAEAVKSVVKRIHEKETQIREGERVTQRHITAFVHAGIAPRRIAWAYIPGSALLLLCAFCIVGAFFRVSDRQVYEDEKRMFMFYILVLIAVLWAMLVHLLQGAIPHFSPYLLGVGIGVMTILTWFLVRPAKALVAPPLLALCIIVAYKMDMSVFVVALVCGQLGYYHTMRRQDMDSIMHAGFSIAASSIALITIMNLLHFTSAKQALLDVLLFGTLNGLLAAVLATGLLPLFEQAFNVITPHRLLELSSPEHPLLKQLLITAPGTYHHSIFVGNLAESVAEALGADPLLVRIACFYHDVGKLKRPYFFVENQMTGVSLLDDVSPSLGALVISSHVKDGVEMMREHNLPEQIIQVASEHHGTCLISFFYQQARSQAKDPETVTEERFRYPGPKPTTIEGAILMLCDGSEAAVRSLKEPSKRNIENLVNTIVKSRLVDGQFERCDITLKQIETARKTISDSLSRIYHARIDYPDEEELKRKVHGDKAHSNGKPQQAHGNS